MIKRSKKIKKPHSKVLENTILLYILTFSSYFFNFVSIPYQTRVLGPEFYGRIGFCLAMTVYFKLFYDFGFILSATEEASKNRDDKESLSNLLSSVNIIKLCFVVISFIPALIMVNTIPTLAQDPVLFMLYFVYIAIDAFQPDFLYRGVEKMRAITIRNVSVKAFFTVMIFILLREQSQYHIIPILNIIGSAVSLGLVYYDVYRRLNVKIKRVSFRETKRIFDRSRMFFVSRIASTVYGATNTFVLGLIYPSGPVLGYYSSSDKILSACRQASSPIADGIYPHMVKTANYGLIKKVLKITMPIIVVGSVVLFIFAEPICVLAFGAEFAGAAVVLRYMTPIIIMTLPAYLLGFPTMTPLGISKKANLSVIYAAIFHATGILLLFATGILNLDSICILTICTEAFVLGLRVFYIVRAKRLKTVA